MSLAPCPCGKVPTRIIVDITYEQSSGLNQFELSGDCCGKWVRLHRTVVAWPKPYQGKRGWNAAPRAKGEE